MATNYKKPNLWTDEEINLLKKLNSKNMSIRDMADFFDNKTLKQVDYKYRYLFTQKQRKNTNKNRKWSEEEVQILKDNYYKSYDELLKLLPKRKKDGIKKKLALLGIKRKKNGMHKGRELEVVELLKTNIVADVVKKTGLSRKAVNQIINKYNVTPIKSTQWYAVDVDIEEETDISVTIHLEKDIYKGE